MKIIHLVDSMEVGGAERVVLLLCRGQRERGDVPSVHCLYRIGPLGEELQAEGFEVVLHQSCSAIGLMRSLFFHFRSSRPDVVHCHNVNPTILGAAPARIAGAKRVVCTRHGLIERPYPHGRELKFAIASRFCHVLVGVCERATQDMIAAPFAVRNRIVCVRNGSQEVRHPDLVPVVTSGFTLLNVGRLSPAKDQESLLHAFALVVKQRPDMRLWLIGDGPLRGALETLASELGIQAAVAFFGEQADVAPFYAAADLFVMSSVTEALPMALLEAMSVGLPAITTDVGGMGEVVRTFRCGLLVPRSAPEQLAEAITQICSDRHELAELGSRARTSYLRHFTTERMCSEYLRLYAGTSD